MEWFIIDGIGPFFRGYGKKRVNWSKIPFDALITDGPGRRAQWDGIAADLQRFCAEVATAGFNTITFDDLAHLATHPAHEVEVAGKIAVFREEFARLFDLVKRESGLRILLTSDVLPTTLAIVAELGTKPADLDVYYRCLIRGVLDDFPQIDGLVLRIGESDGVDVKDPIRTHLHLKTPADANRLLKQLLPDFEKRNKTLVLRTWTVGAHRIGDLIWHRRTLATTLKGLDSAHFIVSMKHGESDFFRYLPLNRSFFTVSQPKIIELQARKEYEGAGEYPSFTGWDHERFAHELGAAENVVGLSVWCQTGGWHRFRRLAFLEENGHDIWIRLNTLCALRIFKDRQTVEQAVAGILGEHRAIAALELLRHADTVIRDLLYVGDFASQKLFFRRVRIPPLLHVYWDSLFINQAVRGVLHHFVRDPQQALRTGEAAFTLFPRMLELANQAGFPADLEHMRDFFHLILLARRFYFLPADEAHIADLRAAKKAYKERWPKTLRPRYRIKLDFGTFHVKRRTLGLASALLLRRRRGYRVIDYLFTLSLLGPLFRVVRKHRPGAIPKVMQKSAMGVESLFR